MSYTCPDCLRTSHHPKDAQENYCARCAAFLPDLNPPPLQQVMITALLGPTPMLSLRVVLVTWRMQQQPIAWDVLLQLLAPLANARKLDASLRDDLVFLYAQLYAGHHGHSPG